MYSADKIQWDKTLTSLRSAPDAVTALFADGAEYTGRLLVACDGARSRARQILYPACTMNPLPVQLLGVSPLYSAEEMGDVQRIDPFIFQGSHPGTNVFLFFSCMFFLPSPLPPSPFFFFRFGLLAYAVYSLGYAWEFCREQ